MTFSRVRYFASFSGYNMPLTPVEELRYDDVRDRRAYCVVGYDGSGRIRAIEKILDGKRFFLHEYTYEEGGTLKEARVTNREGKTTIHRYDSSGKITETTQP